MANPPFSPAMVPDAGQSLDIFEDGRSVDLEDHFPYWSCNPSLDPWQSEESQRDDLRSQSVNTQIWLQDLPTSQPIPDAYLPFQPVYTRDWRTNVLLDNIDHILNQPSSPTTLEFELKSTDAVSISSIVTGIQAGTHTKSFPLQESFTNQASSDYALPSFTRQAPTTTERSSTPSSQPYSIDANELSSQRPQLNRSLAIHPSQRPEGFVNGTFQAERHGSGQFPSFPQQSSTSTPDSQKGPTGPILQRQPLVERKRDTSHSINQRSKGQQRNTEVNFQEKPRARGNRPGSTRGSRRPALQSRASPSRGQRRRRSSSKSDTSNNIHHQRKRNKISRSPPSSQVSLNSQLDPILAGRRSSPHTHVPATQQAVSLPLGIAEPIGSRVAVGDSHNCQDYCPYYRLWPAKYTTKGCSTRKKHSFAQMIGHLRSDHDFILHQLDKQKRYISHPDSGVFLCLRCWGDFATESEATAHYSEHCPYKEAMPKNQKMDKIRTLFISPETSSSDSTGHHPSAIHGAGPLNPPRLATEVPLPVRTSSTAMASEPRQIPLANPVTDLRLSSDLQNQNYFTDRSPIPVGTTRPQENHDLHTQSSVFTTVPPGHNIGPPTSWIFPGIYRDSKGDAYCYLYECKLVSCECVPSSNSPDAQSTSVALDDLGPMFSHAKAQNPPLATNIHQPSSMTSTDPVQDAGQSNFREESGLAGMGGIDRWGAPTSFQAPTRQSHVPKDPLSPDALIPHGQQAKVDLDSGIDTNELDIG